MKTIKARTKSHILRCAKRNDGLTLRRQQADGTWQVQVSASGKLTFGGPAAPHYAPSTTLEQLDMQDVLGLVTEVLRLNRIGFSAADFAKAA